MDSPMKVRIYSNPWDSLTNIAFLVQRNGQWMIAKPMNLEFVPLKEGEVTPASLTLVPEVATEFLKALSQALDDRGIKTDSDAKLQGTLEATKFHLEDMRGLLAWFCNGGEHDHAS
jgi:hypothetical protein